MSRLIDCVLNFLGFNKSNKEQTSVTEINAVNQQQCEHVFKNYRFAKGGGRIATCCKCGYVKHFPLKSN